MLGSLMEGQYLPSRLTFHVTLESEDDISLYKHIFNNATRPLLGLLDISLSAKGLLGTRKTKIRWIVSQGLCRKDWWRCLFTATWRWLINRCLLDGIRSEQRDNVYDAHGLQQTTLNSICTHFTSVIWHISEWNRKFNKTKCTFSGETQ